MQPEPAPSGARKRKTAMDESLDWKFMNEAFTMVSSKTRKQLLEERKAKGNELMEAEKRAYEASHPSDLQIKREILKKNRSAPVLESPPPQAARPIPVEHSRFSTRQEMLRTRREEISRSLDQSAKRDFVPVSIRKRQHEDQFLEQRAATAVGLTQSEIVQRRKSEYRELASQRLERAAEATQKAVLEMAAQADAALAEKRVARMPAHFSCALLNHSIKQGAEFSPESDAVRLEPRDDPLKRKAVPLPRPSDAVAETIGRTPFRPLNQEDVIDPYVDRKAAVNAERSHWVKIKIRQQEPETRNFSDWVPRVWTPRGLKEPLYSSFTADHLFPSSLDSAKSQKKSQAPKMRKVEAEEHTFRIRSSAAPLSSSVTSSSSQASSRPDSESEAEQQQQEEDEDLGGPAPSAVIRLDRDNQARRHRERDERGSSSSPPDSERGPSSVRAEPASPDVYPPEIDELGFTPAMLTPSSSMMSLNASRAEQQARSLLLDSARPATTNSLRAAPCVVRLTDSLRLRSSRSAMSLRPHQQLDPLQQPVPMGEAEQAGELDEGDEQLQLQQQGDRSRPQSSLSSLGVRSGGFQHMLSSDQLLLSTQTPAASACGSMGLLGMSASSSSSIQQHHHSSPSHPRNPSSSSAAAPFGIKLEKVTLP